MDVHGGRAMQATTDELGDLNGPVDTRVRRHGYEHWEHHLRLIGPKLDGHQVVRR
jgi:hypothetical protein